MFALISEARGHGGHGHGMSSKPHVALTIQLSLHPGPQWSILPALAPAVCTANERSAPQLVDKISMSCGPGHKTRQSGTHVNAVLRNLGTLVSWNGVHIVHSSSLPCSTWAIAEHRKRTPGNKRRRHQKTQHKHCCSPS